MFQNLKNRLEKYLLRNVLLSVTSDMIMTYDANKKVAFINGTPVSSKDMRQLKDEAKYFMKSKLYNVLMTSPADNARKVMNEKAISFDDMRHGKIMLHTLSTQNSILDVIDEAIVLDNNLTGNKKG